MRKIRSTESRLRELAESKQYQDDFRKFKVTILSKKEEKTLPKIDLTKHFEWRSSHFLQVDLKRSKETGWMYRKPISPGEVKKILRTGNVNDHWILVPSSCFDLVEKYRLEYLFDPLKEWKKGFNPFKDRPAFLRYSGPQETFETFHIPIVEDVRFKSKERRETVRRLRQLHKKIHGLKEQRERQTYSEAEIEEVRKNPKMKTLALLHRIRPDLSWFHPRRHYLDKDPNERTKDEDNAYSEYRKIARLKKRESWDSQ